MKKISICTRAVSEIGILVSIAISGQSAVAQTQQRMMPPIVGGENVKDFGKEAPFAISLFRYGSFECGGSLIDSHWVLTASHCVSNSAAGLSVHSGSANRNQAAKLGVDQVYIHPKMGDLNGHRTYDFALLHLKSQSLPAGAKPIRIADKAFESSGAQDPGTLTTVFGWGLTDENGNDSSQLMKVTVPVVATATANEAGSYNGAIDESMIAAGYADGGKDSCNGDSGGPLVIQDRFSQEPVLVGVVSWGEGCARKNMYGIYGKVSQVADWIKSVLASH